MLAEEANFNGLARINRDLIGKAEALDFPQRPRAGHGLHRDPGIRPAARKTATSSPPALTRCGCLIGKATARWNEKAGLLARQAGQACLVLLADAGRKPSHMSAVWEHGATD